METSQPFFQSFDLNEIKYEDEAALFCVNHWDRRRRTDLIKYASHFHDAQAGGTA